MSDYHLDKVQQERVEKIVPLHQAKIHIAFKANLVTNNKKYPNGAVALSEHMIIFCKQSLIGKNYTLLKQMHLLDIVGFSTSSENQCKVRGPSDSIEIESGAVLRFARILIRNCYVITLMFPPNLRFQFTPHDATRFPKFDPKLSPSQMFQFSYNANCSYYNTSYCHDVTRFFHKMVVQGNGIADLCHLPASVIEANLGDPIQLRPLFAAFIFCPIIFGISIRNIARPDIALSLAPLISANSDIRFVAFPYCQVENGAGMIAKAIENNPGNGVVYWDLSYNNLKDIGAFCSALSITKAPVFYLNLDCSGLNEQATEILIRSISSNTKLWDIRYLHLRGAQFNDKIALRFIRHIERLHAAKRFFLKSLVLADVQYDINGIIVALGKWPQPIEHLDISNTKIKERTYENLIHFISKSKTIKSLCVRNSGLKVDKLTGILKALSVNPKVKTADVDLSNNKLNGKKLNQIIDLIKASDKSKWAGLSFDENGLNAADLEALIDLFKQLPQLKKVSLSRNFTKHTKNISQTLANLTTVPTLEHLVIQGSNEKGLGSALIPMLKSLKSSQYLKKLDIQMNHIGDEGITVVSHLLLASRSLVEIEVNGSFPKKQETLIQFFDVISSNQNLLHCDFPQDDIYYILGTCPNAMKLPAYEMFSAKQVSFQDNLAKNISEAGMLSHFSLRNMPELDELIENITTEVNERLDGVKLNEHSSIGQVFGLPLPYLAENAEPDKQSIQTVSEGGSIEKQYDLKETNIKIVENNTDLVQSADEGQFKTLMFNSLIIKRGSEELARIPRQDSSLGLTSPDTFDESLGLDHSKPKSSIKSSKSNQSSKKSNSKAKDQKSSKSSKPKELPSAARIKPILLK